MPIPKPSEKEMTEKGGRGRFTKRCHEALASEFPDSKQRHAVCMTSWRDGRKELGKKRRKK